MPKASSPAEPTTTLDPRFSEPDAMATPWSEGRWILETAQTYWLSTVKANRRPHVTTVAAIWMDEALHVTTGDREQKRHNLATNPACVVTTGCSGFEGMDVVVEAEARIVRSVVRGPAIIGHGAVIENAYIGPFTAIGDGVTVCGSEVEHSIILEGSTVTDVGARLESSLLGRGARVYRAATKPRAYNLMLGDRSQVGLV